MRSCITSNRINTIGRRFCSSQHLIKDNEIQKEEKIPRVYYGLGGSIWCNKLSRELQYTRHPICRPMEWTSVRAFELNVFVLLYGLYALSWIRCWLADFFWQPNDIIIIDRSWEGALNGSRKRTEWWTNKTVRYRARMSNGKKIEVKEEMCRHFRTTITRQLTTTEQRPHRMRSEKTFNLCNLY